MVIEVDEYGPVLRAQFPQRRPDAVGKQEVTDVVFRCWNAREILYDHFGRSGAASSERVNDKAAGHRVQPWSEDVDIDVGIWAEVTPRPHECLLHDVLGGAIIAQHQLSDVAQQRVFEPLVQGGELGLGAPRRLSGRLPGYHSHVALR